MKQSKAGEAVACFNDGFSCSQAILSTYCGELGLDKKTALLLACGLGAGMGRLGDTCGAVSGAYFLIGLKYGKYLKGDDQAKEKTYAMVQEFSKLVFVRIGVQYHKGLGLLIAVLVSVFIGQEYLWKTWQHKWIAGKSRMCVYLSKAILSSVISAAYSCFLKWWYSSVQVKYKKYLRVGM